ncbi:portal protein [Bajunvirus bajun]|uniref:Portal protein n=1 Tax=Brevundimonas phage vB_BgoS-Bajun TaxID=2948594 RepID=A0A9E7N4P1_9CAUD|nr:portal protein [Brevundimonas phage vB_BgoS-Bajun]
MSGQTPNSTNIDRVARATSQAVYLVTHPEYQYWRPEWTKLRDVISGQREIKRKGRAYLPGMKGADTDDYAIYLERATFYNMTGQTVNGMVGQVFRRDPVIRGLPDRFKTTMRKFGKDGSTHVLFAKSIVAEQATLGRVGVLVDAPPTMTKGIPSSFAVAYSAENILDWDVTTSEDGFLTPLRVLLREFARDDGVVQAAKPLTSAEARKRRAQEEAAARAGKPMVRQSRAQIGGYSYKTIYRELVLEQIPYPDGVYRAGYVQYVYEEDPNSQPIDRIVPTVRGMPWAEIPFQMFGASSNNFDVEKPPVLEIADLNISHYRTYAELEYGRLFTALPVYYAPGTDGEGTGEYHIGPNMVWEVPQGSTPGILEYTGQGLNALVVALNSKEQQIAAIGGRMMPGASKSTSESNQQTSLREANEQSLLLNIVQANEHGMANVVRWYLIWRDATPEEVAELRYEINTDFLSTPIGAREIRAVQMMFNDGLLTVPQLYTYLRKAEIVGSDTSVEEFEAQLRDPNSFFNNPDAQAKLRGFANRAQELLQNQLAREADFEQQSLDLQERQIEMPDAASRSKMLSANIAANTPPA